MRRLAHVRSSGRGPVSVIRYFRSRFVISLYLCSRNPAETRPWADSGKYSCWRRAGIPGVGRVVGLICHVAATLHCDFVLSLFFYSILFRFVFHRAIKCYGSCCQDCTVSCVRKRHVRTLSPIWVRGPAAPRALFTLIQSIREQIL